MTLILNGLKVKIWFQNKRSKYKKTGKNGKSPNRKNSDENDGKKSDQSNTFLNESTVAIKKSDSESSNDSMLSTSSSSSSSNSGKTSKVNEESYLQGIQNVKQHQQTSDVIFNQQYQNYQITTHPSNLYPSQPSSNQCQYQRNYIQNSTHVKNDSEILLSRLVSNNDKFFLNTVFSPTNYSQNPTNFNNPQNTTFMMTTTNGTTIESPTNYFTSNNNQHWAFPTPGSSSAYNSHTIQHQMIIPGMQ